MSEKNTDQKIKDIIVEQLSVNAEQVTPEAKFIEDLGADWLTMRADGTAQLDVRIVINTDDGAAIHVAYKGIMSPDANGNPRIITAPLFETGAENYTWLNGIQAIAVGAPGAGTVDYDLYRLV
jgi:hypothetical protein